MCSGSCMWWTRNLEPGFEARALVKPQTSNLKLKTENNPLPQSSRTVVMRSL
jgi:hypothetical protein